MAKMWERNILGSVNWGQVTDNCEKARWEDWSVDRNSKSQGFWVGQWHTKCLYIGIEEGPPLLPGRKKLEVRKNQHDGVNSYLS